MENGRKLTNFLSAPLPEKSRVPQKFKLATVVKSRLLSSLLPGCARLTAWEIGNAPRHRLQLGNVADTTQNFHDSVVFK